MSAMLAVATTSSLSITETQSLRRATSLAPTCTLDSPPTCHAWTPDNSSLILAQCYSISRYDPSGTFTKTLYDDATGESGAITALAGERVRILDAHTGKISSTFDTHKAPVVSLSLSNDASLLASTSANAVHVHNLTHGAHTVLRGIPAGECVMTCAFHPHARTRLLVGTGARVLVYDTTRPSGPLKTIAVSTKKDSSGEIVSIASSPFSKTLVAVACSGGSIALVDLEKDRDKSVYKTWSVHVPITCLAFSADGAVLYVGTENGKVLGQDLRSLDKPPRSTTVSENGDRVVALSMQKKLKPEDTASPAKASAASKKPAPSKPLVQQDQNKTSAPRSATARSDKPEKKTVTSPLASRTLAARGSPALRSRVTSSGSPRAVRPRAGAGVKSPAARKISAGGVSKKIFSPPRSPPMRRGQTDEEPEDLNVSVRIENLLNLPVSTRAKENIIPAGSSLEPVTEGMPPSISTAAPRATTRTATAAEHRTRADGTNLRRASALSTASASTRTRSASGSTASSGRASKASTRPTSAASSRTSPSAPPVPKVPSAYRAKGTSRQSLTPSPELPDVDEDAPATPLPMGRRAGKAKAGGMGILGLGTPEVDRWIKAGEVGVANKEHNRADGKKVGFAGDGDDDEVEFARRVPLPGDAVTEPAFAMQVSPARRPGLASGSSASWAAAPSPLRNLSHSASQPHLGSPNTRAAAGLLQTLLRDAMYEFRQETHGELVGLHLDMLRMGRGLRGEMRAAVDEFRGEISVLREENRALKEENERLKRGY
ncbi:WD40-repeat-containing domain protein [Fomitopsis serialis]|uniref:WD40-repeat-containing domain protein n=1 Tax=Fomitopsis serialis TaxID=139415 RepID=UPI002008A810|nr:WD40-repeat-containing domain protein [Neoantrodia serialis]KAH9928089.1 WD40-repeat-containing domain protein [Neoantrodia serialis]